MRMSRLAFIMAIKDIDEQKGNKTYLITHMRNQLSFDLWYVFLGVFCICAAESKRIMNPDDPVVLPFCLSTTLYHINMHCLSMHC